MGDFSAADFPSLQAALDAARDDPGSRVRAVPGESYPLATELRIYGKTRLEAWGADLFGVDGNHRLLRSYSDGDSYSGYNGPSDITVLGGTWDCRGYDSPPNALLNAMDFCHGHNINVVGCRIRNVVGAHAVEFAAINGGSVRDCRFEGFFDPGDREFSEAVQLDWPRVGSTDIGLWDGTPCRGISVTRCAMSSSEQLGPFGALVGSHGDNLPPARHEWIKVADCEVDKSLSFAVRAFGWRDSVVHGVTAFDTDGTAFLVQNSDGLAVHGNTVREAGRNGFHVGSSQRVAISGNVVNRTRDQYGIWVGKYGQGDGSSDVLVSGNVVSGAALAGVRLSAGANRCVVEGNMLRRDGGGDTGVSCAAGAGTSNRVARNSITGFATAVDVVSGSVDDG